MKKLFKLVLLSTFLTIIFFSCNKDTTVNPGGGPAGPVTQSFTSSPTLNKVISNTQPVLDTISANITDNILSNSISDIKITLGDVENVEVDKIQFSILHGSTEVIVIDYLTKTGVGSFINTVLWDSATTFIDQGQSPYTGTFIPQQPLRNFNSSDPAGQWIIKITYSGSVKSGVIKSWGISITYNKVQTPANAIVPLAVGNIWITETRDGGGNLLGTDTVNIPFSITYQNKTIYYIYRGYDATDSIYGSNESNGLWVYDITNNISELMWKYPINTGETYYQSMNNDTIRCLSNNETVMTPLGPITGCIKYATYDQGLLHHVNIFKPNLGIIGNDDYYNGILDRTERLSYYHLNK